MKIVFILPGSSRSGGVKSTVTVANKLLERGHNVRILCRKTKKSIRGMYKTLFFAIRHYRNSTWLKGFKGRTNFKTAVKTKGIVKQSVFMKNPINESTPLTGEGRKSSMIDAPFL